MNPTPIDQVRPGDIVAEDVHNETGGILVPAKTCLSETHLRRLKTAGISALHLTREAAEVTATLPPVAKRLEDLHARFAQTEDPDLLQIRDIVAHRLQAMLPPTNA